ncbi:hypothetical protein [Paenibacillus qinlingensis]|nr:hypothetical protein [Paenibacillus qinlingensis]
MVYLHLLQNLHMVVKHTPLFQVQLMLARDAVYLFPGGIVYENIVYQLI